MHPQHTSISTGSSHKPRNVVAGDEESLAKHEHAIESSAKSHSNDVMRNNRGHKLQHALSNVPIAKPLRRIITNHNNSNKQTHEQTGRKHPETVAPVREPNKPIHGDCAKQCDQKDSRNAGKGIGCNVRCNLRRSTPQSPRGRQRSSRSTNIVVTVGAFTNKDGTIFNERRHNGNRHEDKEGSGVKQQGNSILNEYHLHDHERITEDNSNLYMIQVVLQVQVHGSDHQTKHQEHGQADVKHSGIAEIVSPTVMLKSHDIQNNITQRQTGA